MLEPAGTAPGARGAAGRRAAGPTVVVLPGPPRELHAMWPAASATEASSEAAIGGRTEYDQHMLRLFGIPESEIAETLRVAEGQIAGLRRAARSRPACAAAEVEVVVRHEPRGRGAA